ncbi:DNA-binding protein [Atopobium sp. BV3Ac4]|uniref:DNA-binding protein n=1 Tax=Atopobium sp. BV3Ac4 TaxID=1111121 RepID=UPI0003AE5030|nr:DNA-binding protein [Atopobium sp. BV3Ac4]ERL15472.1 DNA-binding helix-turn-helix protein [Atopobium sp. BV3Ac4]
MNEKAPTQKRKLAVPDGPLLITTRQAARYLGIGEEKIRELTEQKYNPLPCVRLPNAKYPYYTKETLYAYIQKLALASTHTK